MKKLAFLLSLAAVLLGCTGALYAASTIYGISGLIETPDDTILAPKSISLTANEIINVGGDNAVGDQNLTTFGGGFGLIPKLEVSAVGIASDAEGVDTVPVINAKYRILAESVGTPSITVGVVDIADQLDEINGSISDPSAFIVFGKNITSVAEGVSGGLVKPVKGTVGIGTGIYKGAFVGLNVALFPKTDVLFEYLSNGIRQETTINAALRFRPIEPLAISVGTLGFDGFYAGASFNLSTF